MNCEKFEQLIALYVEDDLSVEERQRVETHLRECSECWDLAEDLKESQTAFKAIRADVPDATALAVLHDRVLSSVRDRRPSWWFPRLVFASVALAMVGVGAWRMSSPPIVVRNFEPQRQTVTSPLASPPQGEKTTVVAPKPVRKTEEEPRPQVAIKLLTDDPNVIIYWLVDEKGD